MIMKNKLNIKEFEKITTWKEFWNSVFQFQKKLYEEYQDVIELILFVSCTAFYFYLFEKKWKEKFYKRKYIFDEVVHSELVNNHWCTVINSKIDKIEFFKFINSHYSNIEYLNMKNFELVELFYSILSEDEDVATLLDVNNNWEYFRYSRSNKVYFWKSYYQNLFFLFHFPTYLIDKKRFETSKYYHDFKIWKIIFTKTKNKYLCKRYSNIKDLYRVTIKIIKFFNKKELLLKNNLWIYYLLLKELLYFKDNYFENKFIDNVSKTVFDLWNSSNNFWIQCLHKLFWSKQKFKEEIWEYLYWDKAFSKEILRYYSDWYDVWSMKLYKLLKDDYKIISEQYEKIWNQLWIWYCSFLDQFWENHLRKYYI